jgi:hypothetical protein
MQGNKDVYDSIYPISAMDKGVARGMIAKTCQMSFRLHLNAYMYIDSDVLKSIRHRLPGFVSDVGWLYYFSVEHAVML